MRTNHFPLQPVRPTERAELEDEIKVLTHAGLSAVGVVTYPSVYLQKEVDDQMDQMFAELKE